ncbi:adenylyltransferase/cytidyltransferase family protein [Ligilactobacillus ruminis]|uniref:adenylyltransferase/cytidyltransferase family protein n=1 Tax=Ligilactobacillus ruminis TaxID=1623 RepID=UPI001F26902E|nr:adenylyltransferase/cytidyltransferase family protein [Ligilactobacillus ruminis]MCF2544354.1 adenylyltransferase/cytidyltransferase family protein [Ligilactobacillus ruminis]
MKKVITYGTFDMLHQGHLNILKRAKELGDYLIVGVTSDDFDSRRGKINVQQSMMERVEGVKETGLADQIIIEEYEGQKIDDINRFGIDIFAIGSDWQGKFDYLSEFCKVVYLERTKGISSTQIRSENNRLKLGLVGKAKRLWKVANEAGSINGIDIVGTSGSECDRRLNKLDNYSFEELIEKVEAVFIESDVKDRYEQIKYALERGKHVLCDLPMTIGRRKQHELLEIAKKNDCVLMSGIKTAYSTAYYRLLLMIKSGEIGNVLSVETTCTSLSESSKLSNYSENNIWSAMDAWGATALMPIFQVLGTNYVNKTIISKKIDSYFDLFTKMDFIYKDAVATAKIGKGVKSEGEMIISGTKGYAYVPAPWWKTDYFEIRYEDQNRNKRFFYELEGEGFKYELVNFLRAINHRRTLSYTGNDVLEEISQIYEEFYNRKGIIRI